MKNLKKIDLNKLSKKRKLVIQYAIDHPDKVVLMRLEEFARKLGVDSTTIVKACKAVELNGFHELKELLKPNVKLTTFDQMFNEFIVEIDNYSNPQNIAQEALMGDIMMLKKTYDTINIQVLDKIAKGILKARTNYILGLGSFGLIAKYMERIFLSVTPNVHSITEYHGELFGYMAHFDKNDLVCVISLGVPQNQALSAIQFAKERGALTVGIVDSENSELIKDCDYYLIIDNTVDKAFGTMIGAFSLVNAIFHCLVSLSKTKTIESFKFARKMYNKENVFKS